MSPSFRAYAKINLGLRVLGRRADGFHDICTVFHRIGLFDEIRYEPSHAIEVVSSSAEVPGDESNLCFRAARALQESGGGTRGVRIHLGKAIPVGAGLGGGSSDAATVLRTLPAFWGMHAARGLQAELAARLGSDVPYFLRDGSALGTGRGEILEYFSLDLPYAILVCHPGIHVSTPWAYAQLQHERRPCPDLRAALGAGLSDPLQLREHLGNDFEKPVFNRFPVIREIKESMLLSGAVFASLSGTGSAVYGLFPGDNQAAMLAAQFQSRGYSASLTPPHFTTESPAPPAGPGEAGS